MRLLFGCRDRDCFSKTDNLSHIKRTGPPLLLLAAAVQLGRQINTLPNHQGADTFGAIDLVGG